MSQAVSPYILLAYQQRWVADETGIKVAEKGRRIGLTWAEAADDVLIAAVPKSQGGQNAYYIGYNQDMAKEFISECATWAKHFDKAFGDIEEEVLAGEGKDGEDILTYVIKFASGNFIKALSSRPANLRGKQGVVVIDEAAFHDDLPGLLKAAVALRMWGGKVRVISTHDGEDNPFNELIHEIRAGKRPGAVHRTTFQDAIKQGLHQRICLKAGTPWTPEGEVAYVAGTYAEYGDDAAEELDVIPSKGSGAYLTRAMIEGIMDPDIPVLRLSMQPEFTQLGEHLRVAEIHDWCEANLLPLLQKMDPRLLSYFGEDFARLGDLTAIVPFQRLPNLKKHVPFVLEMRGIPFEQQKQVLFYLVDRLPRFTAGAMDARGNGHYLAEVAQQRYGVTRIEAVMLSQPWYIEHMPRFKAAFEDQTIDLPRDAEILDDMRAVKMEKGVAKVPDGKKTKSDRGGYRHGDVAIALVLGLYAEAVMDPAPIEFASTGQQRVSMGAYNDTPQSSQPANATDTGFGTVAGGMDLTGY